MAGTDANDKNKNEGEPGNSAEGRGEPSGGLLSGIGATTAGLTDDAIAAEAATDVSCDRDEAGDEDSG